MHIARAARRAAARNRPRRCPADRRVGALGRVEELRRGHRAQRVGREIAPGAVIPMDVLETALAVVGRRRRRAARSCPRSTRPADPSSSRSPAIMRALQPVAQDHMRGIGDLVGIDADQAALDPGVEAVEIFGLPCRARAAEALAQDAARRTRGTRASGRACISISSDWLSWMLMPRACADRLAAPGGGQAALVERVAGLVQHAHQRAARNRPRRSAW